MKGGESGRTVKRNGDPCSWGGIHEVKETEKAFGLRPFVIPSWRSTQPNRMDTRSRHADHRIEVRGLIRTSKCQVEHLVDQT